MFGRHCSSDGYVILRRWMGLRSWVRKHPLKAPARWLVLNDGLSAFVTARQVFSFRDRSCICRLHSTFCTSSSTSTTSFSGNRTQETRSAAPIHATLSHPLHDPSSFPSITPAALVCSLYAYHTLRYPQKELPSYQQESPTSLIIPLDICQAITQVGQYPPVDRYHNIFTNGLTWHRPPTWDVSLLCFICPTRGVLQSSATFRVQSIWPFMRAAHHHH